MECTRKSDMMSFVSVKQRGVFAILYGAPIVPISNISRSYFQKHSIHKKRTNERFSTNNAIKLSDFPLAAYKSGNTKFPLEWNPTRHTADETILWYNYHYHSQSSLHTKATASSIPLTLLYHTYSTFETLLLQRQQRRRQQRR